MATSNITEVIQNGALFCFVLSAALRQYVYLLISYHHKGLGSYLAPCYTVRHRKEILNPVQGT